jgi:hypothetical protein
MATFIMLFIVFGCGGFCGLWLGYEMAKAPLEGDDI